MSESSLNILREHAAAGGGRETMQEIVIQYPLSVLEQLLHRAFGPDFVKFECYGTDEGIRIKFQQVSDVENVLDMNFPKGMITTAYTPFYVRGEVMLTGVFNSVGYTYGHRVNWARDNPLRLTVGWGVFGFSVNGIRAASNLTSFVSGGGYGENFVVLTENMDTDVSFFGWICSSSGPGTAGGLTTLVPNERGAIQYGYPINDTVGEYIPEWKPKFAWAMKYAKAAKHFAKMTGKGRSHGLLTFHCHLTKNNFGMSMLDESGKYLIPFNTPYQRLSVTFKGRTRAWKKQPNIPIRDIEFNADLAPLLVLGDVSGDECVVEFINGYRTDADDVPPGIGIAHMGGEFAGHFVRLKSRLFIAGDAFTSDKPLATTAFSKNYRPPVGIQLDYTAAMNPNIGDDMTPEEREIVGRWFTEYLNGLVRRGARPTEDDLDTAKVLGVYTGD